MNRRVFIRLASALAALPAMAISCTSNQATALLNAIVAAGEALIANPQIGNQPASVINYINQGLAIVTGLIDGGITTATIQAAVTALAALIQSFSSSSDSPAFAWVLAFTNAISAFLKAYATTPAPSISASDIEKQQPKLLAISGRAHAAMQRLGARKVTK